MADSSDESEDFSNLPPVKIPTTLEDFDWPTDESVDAHSAYSACNICFKKLKGRCFSEACLHKFCLKCSYELIRVRNQEKSLDLFSLFINLFFFFFTFREQVLNLLNENAQFVGSHLRD